MEPQLTPLSTPPPSHAPFMAATAPSQGTAAPTQDTTAPPQRTSPLASLLSVGTGGLKSAASTAVAAGAAVSNSPAAIAEHVADAVQMALSPVLERLEAGQGRLEAGQVWIRGNLTAASQQRRALFEGLKGIFDTVDDEAREQQEERAAAAAARVAAAAEQEASATERTATVEERDAAAVERQAAAVERQAAAVERQAAAAARAETESELARLREALSRETTKLRTDPSAWERATEDETSGLTEELVTVGKVLITEPPPKSLLATGVSALVEPGKLVLSPVMSLLSPVKSPAKQARDGRRVQPPRAAAPSRSSKKSATAVTTDTAATGSLATKRTGRAAPSKPAAPRVVRVSESEKPPTTVRGVAALLADVKTDEQRRLTALDMVPSLVEQAEADGKLGLVTKPIKGGCPAPLVASLVASVAHPSDSVAMASAKTIVSLCEAHVDSVHELGVAALSVFLGVDAAERSTEVQKAFADAVSILGGLKLSAEAATKVVNLLACVARNGFPDKETGFPPSAREAAGYGLEAFLNRPDAHDVLATSMQLIFVPDAIASLLNAKRETIATAGFDCFSALETMGEARAARLIAEIKKQVSPPILKKLGGAFSTIECH